MVEADDAPAWCCSDARGGAHRDGDHHDSRGRSTSFHGTSVQYPLCHTLSGRLVSAVNRTEGSRAHAARTVSNRADLERVNGCKQVRSWDGTRAFPGTQAFAGDRPARLTEVRVESG